MSDPARTRNTVYVGGLDGQVTEQTLHDAFIPFGEIVNVSLPKPELCVCDGSLHPNAQLLISAQALFQGTASWIRLRRVLTGRRRQ